MAAYTQRGFYEAAAQIIPILLLALAVGESRLKFRARGKPLVVIGAAFFFGCSVVGGEIAALRVLETGHDSAFLKGVTVISLSFGFAFLLQYLAWAAYRDIAGEDASPSLAVINALSTISILVSVAIVLVLTG